MKQNNFTYSTSSERKESKAMLRKILVLLLSGIITCAIMSIGIMINYN